MKLVPNEQVIEVREFETADPHLRGEMRITTMLADPDGGTDLLVLYEAIPSAAATTDNEAGTKIALDNLAALVESTRCHRSAQGEMPVRIEDGLESGSLRRPATISARGSNSAARDR